MESVMKYQAAVFGGVLLCIMGWTTSPPCGMERMMTALGLKIGLLQTTHCTNDRNALSTIRTLVSAQEDFQTYDRDGDGSPQYWRDDVAGLYSLEDRSGIPLKLIEASVATADAQPAHDWGEAESVSKAGYWYRALRFAGEELPDPAKFAFCAFPDSPSAGIWTFVVSHDNVFYRKKGGAGSGVLVFPSDPVGEGWSKID
jgi:hypothetical protein